MSTTDGPTDGSTREDRLRELPPSAKLVAKVLEYDGDATQGQLAEETLLPSRTVRYALGRLEEANVVDSRFSFTDARKRVYSLRVEGEAADERRPAARAGATSDPLSERL